MATRHPKIRREGYVRRSVQRRSTKSAAVSRCLPQYRTQRPGGRFAVHWDDDRPPLLAEFTWLERWLTCLYPAFTKAAWTSAPLATGSAGLTQTAGPWR